MNQFESTELTNQKRMNINQLTIIKRKIYKLQIFFDQLVSRHIMLDTALKCHFRAKLDQIATSTQFLQD